MALHIYICIHRAGSKTIQRVVMVMATSVINVMKMGNIVLGAGIKLTSLSFQARVLSLHHIGSLMSPLYPRPPVYVAPCLRGQCRLLHL